MSVTSTPSRSYNPITGQPSPPSARSSVSSPLHTSHNTSATTSPSHSRTTSTVPSRQPSFSTPSDGGGASSAVRHERTPSMGWSAADVISAPLSQSASDALSVADAASPTAAASNGLSEDDTAPLVRQNEVLSHPASDEQPAAASASARSRAASRTSAAAASAASHARNTTFSSSFLRSNKLGMATLPLPAASSTTSSTSSFPVLRASPRVRTATTPRTASATPRTASSAIPRFALPTASVAAHRGELRAQTARGAVASSIPSSVRGARRPLLDAGGGLEADDVSLLSSLHELPSTTTELLTLLFPSDTTVRSKCEDVLRRENVDMTALLMLTQTHMRQMGLTVGVRVKLACAVYVMRKMKGLEVADRGLIDPNNRTIARRPAQHNASDVSAVANKPAQSVATVRAEKADAAEQPSTTRRAASTKRLNATSPIKPRHTSPTKPHAATVAANGAPVVPPQRSQEMRDKLNSSTTAALKAKFQALNNKYKDNNHTAQPAAQTDEQQVSPRKTARRLLVERKETVIDNDEEEARQDDKKRVEEERKEKLRVEREKKKVERERAKEDAAAKQAAEREEKDAERKRKEEERGKAAAAEKEKKRAEVEKAKHKVAPKPADSKKEDETQESTTHQQSKDGQGAAAAAAAAADKHKEHKERTEADKERPASLTSTTSSSVLRRSSTPIVLKRGKKADGTSALTVAASTTEDEAKTAESEVGNAAQPSATFHTGSTPVSISKLSLPDIPLSYSTTSSSPLLSSTTTTTTSASSSSLPSSSASASSATAAGEALAKAKARIQAAKEARESLKTNSTTLLNYSNNSNSSTANTASAQSAQSSHQQQQADEEGAVSGLDGHADGSGVEDAGEAGGEHRRRVSHVGGLIDQFETSRR